MFSDTKNKTTMNNSTKKLNEDVEKKIEFADYLLNCKNLPSWYKYNYATAKTEIQLPVGLSNWDKKFLKGIVKIQYYPNPSISDKQLKELFRIGRLNVGIRKTKEFLGNTTQFQKNVNVIGVMIRKKGKSKGMTTNPSYTLLEKEILTTHKKLKKVDKSVITTYSIEVDNSSKRAYHIHILLKYTNEQNYKNVLSKYIGGESWNKTIEDYGTIEYCNGKWGEVVLHEIYDEKGFTSYMSKMKCGIVKQLV